LGWWPKWPAFAAPKQLAREGKTESSTGSLPCLTLLSERKKKQRHKGLGILGWWPKWPAFASPKQLTREGKTGPSHRISPVPDF